MMIVKKKLLIFLSILSVFLIVFLSFMMAARIKAKEDKEEVSLKYGEFFIDSTLFTHKDDLSIYNQGAVDLTDFNKKLENSNFELYSNSKSGAIRVKNLTTGYIWCSDVFDFDPEETTNAVRKIITSSFRIALRDADNQTQAVYTTDSGVKLTESVSGNTLKVDASSSKVSVKFTYEITLTDTGIDVKLKNDSIKEDGDYKITKITLFPYFGSAYEDKIPGYVFIPAGSGALIRYSKASPITTSFIASFYGTDANINRNLEEDVLSIPVFGCCHGVNQNAMFAHIKSGSAFASLVYAPGNIDQNYNLIYSEFNMRDTYTINIPGSGDVFMIPEDFHHEDIEISYTFLSNNDANYVGMAKAYQKELETNKIIVKKQDATSNIKMQIEAFGRDYENGLIFKKYKNMTTTKDILAINKELNNNGIENIVYVLRAFNKRGYSAQSASNYKFDSRLGSMKSLKDLDAYIYYNPVESYNSKKSYPKNVLVNAFNEKHFVSVGKEKYKFYSNVASVVKYTTKALNYYDSIALDGIGYRLYGDKNNKLARYEALNELISILGDKKTAMFSPNEYFFKNTSSYFNMSLYSARYRFVTDSVPFLEIALKGYIDYYSPYLNFSSNIDLDTLKCIEYGVNPAFLVTKEASYLLSNTLSSNYYATYYETLKDIIMEKYNYINSALSKVTNATIENREIVEEGVSVVTYSNGVKIVVNYTKNDYNYMGTNITALGYKVI